MENAAAAEQPKPLTYPESLVKRVIVEIDGKQFPLKRFTFKQEILLRQEFNGDLEVWRKKIEQLDGETILRTFFIFMEPNDTYKTVDQMAESLNCTMEEKWNMLNAITFCMVGAKPEVQDALKKNTKAMVEKLQTEVMNKLTGMLSSIDSIQPTDGDLNKSST